MASQCLMWVGTFSVFLLAWMVFSILRKHKAKTKKNTRKSTSRNAEAKRRCENGETDVIIVGAGVAGSVLAYALAKDGWRVHVIERDLGEPDKISGEVMQPGGVLMLIHLGLRDCLEEIDAQKLNSLVVYKDGKHSYMPYPLEEKKFPFDASGQMFHHGRFIQRLRQKAVSLPNVQLEEGTVNSLIEEGGVIKGVRYKRKSGQEATASASLTIVCDGSYSNLRRSLSDSKVDVQSYLTGLISKNCRLPNPESIHVVMSQPSFTVLYHISSTEVRCMVEIPAKSTPSVANGDMSSFLEKTIAPQVPPKLYDIFMKSIAEKTIKVVPIKRMKALKCEKAGAIVIGDAFNMRHPINASGMMVALSDIIILRNLLRPLHSLDDSHEVSQVLTSFYALRKPMATMVNALANAFHHLLLATPDEAKGEMRKACFDYLSSGGVCTSGMMALFSGLNSRPLSLILHLSAITLLAVARLLFPFPSPRRLWISLQVLKLAGSILIPSLKSEGVIPMFSPATAVTSHISTEALNP